MYHFDKWKAVDNYITDLLVPTDLILEEVLPYSYKKDVDFTIKL